MHLRIKICGIKAPADARVAVSAGADAIGLNFYPPSPRYLGDPQSVAEIISALPPCVDSFGVFVTETWEQACAIAQRHGLRTVQMHGDAHEPGARLRLCRVDAFRVGNVDDLSQINAYLTAAADAHQLPAAVLIDANVKGQFGGTGQIAPWNLLADKTFAVPLILAGGLTPENVAEAVRIVRPFGVDVAGGVETAPGFKDPTKIQRFIDNARNAAAKLN